VCECLLANLKQSSKLFMDETTAPVLDSGRQKTKTGYFWALARDDRPWCGDAPPGVAFTYASGRGGKYATKILQCFDGIPQAPSRGLQANPCRAADGYAGYNRLLDRQKNGGIQVAYCWAHARRKLYDVAKASTAPIAQEGLKQIAALYHCSAGEWNIHRERGSRQASKASPPTPALPPAMIEQSQNWQPLKNG